MWLQHQLYSLLATSLITGTSALNILVNNDDSWGSANIRELYRVLRKSGHNAYMVAPANAQSGQGGRLGLSNSSTLTAPSLYGLLPAGAPSVGHDADDDHIWYYDGTPAACTLVALDYVLPSFADFDVPDLLVSGPNFGDNVGTFAFTGSGTIGATYTAVERDIPGIAFSSPNAEQSYLEIANETDSLPTQYAELSVGLVNRLAKATPKGGRLLPYGYGLNVNYPLLNSSCTSPPFVASRTAGGAGMPKLALNTTTGVFGIAGGNYFGVVSKGLNQCYNGDCSEPGESVVVTACESAVSIFTVDFDAPQNKQTTLVRSRLGLDAKNGWSYSHHWA